MNYIFSEVALGESLVDKASELSAGWNKGTRNIIRGYPRSVAAAHMALLLDPLTDGESVRAYPVVPHEQCRIRTEELTVNGDYTACSKSLIDVPFLAQMCKNSELVSARLWNDLAGIEVASMGKDKLIVRAQFHIPRAMTPAGWLIVCPAPDIMAA